MHRIAYLALLQVLVVLVLEISAFSRCPRGSYEVHTVNRTNGFCDDCGTKNLLTPCATVRCGGQAPECKLIYKSSTDIADCAYGKIPLQPVCRQRCADSEVQINCITGSVVVQTIEGCKSCYQPDPKYNFLNPCAQRNACSNKEQCLLQQVECIRAPCYPVKLCCPRDVCLTNSLRYTDSNGCPRCYACNGCLTKRCGKFQKCILEEVRCKMCPCPPIARCVSVFS